MTRFANAGSGGARGSAQCEKQRAPKEAKTSG
jgi:hypothetical protein